MSDLALRILALAAVLLAIMVLIVAAVLAFDRRRTAARQPVKPVDEMWDEDQTGQALRQMASTGLMAEELDTVTLNPRRGVTKMPAIKPDELPTLRPAVRSHRHGDSGRWRQ